MRKRRCPACGAKVGRDNLMCGSCGFVMPIDAPEVGGSASVVPRPRTMPMQAESASLLEIPIPGSRQLTKLLFVGGLGLLFFAATDLWGRLVVLAILVPMISSDVFSVFGWEVVVLTESELRIERRLFGRTLKTVRIARSDIESITVPKKAKGLKGFFQREDKDQNLWTFSDGPIVVESSSHIYKFGQGLIEHRDIAREVASRLNREVFGTPSA